MLEHAEVYPLFRRGISIVYSQFVMESHATFLNGSGQLLVGKLN